MSRYFSHSPLDFRSMSPVIRWLILANLAAFGLSWLVGPEMDLHFGLIPVHVWRDRWVWQLVTYMFLHGGMMHLLFNLLALWMFAVPVEAQWGPGEFLKYYFICGVGAGVLSVAVHPWSTNPIVGASGAIYGLLVAFAMLYPEAVVYLYGFFPLKARDMAILFGVVEFFTGVTASTPLIARFAHLGGMVIGYLYIRWWWVLKLQAKGFWSRAVSRAATSRPITFRVPEADRPVPKAGAPPPPSSMDEVDRILDKISAYGKDSLSPAELEILRRHSERNPSETKWKQ